MGGVVVEGVGIHAGSQVGRHALLLIRHAHAHCGGTEGGGEKGRQGSVVMSSVWEEGKERHKINKVSYKEPCLKK